MDRKTRSKLLKYARPFDLCLAAKDAEFSTLIDQLFDEARTAGHFAERISTADQKRDLGMLVANVLKAEQTAFNPFQRIPRRPTHYRASRYNALGVSYRGTRRAFEAMLACNYLRSVSGFRNPATGRTKVTRIRASSKLKALFDSYSAYDYTVRPCRVGETILLRDAKKNFIDYTDTPEIRKWRENLERINDALARNWIDLYVPDDELVRINEILNLEKDKQPIDFERKRLRRIFNNGRFDEGGRFYHGWWQEIPSEYRQYVRVKDKDTVEVDFSGMHPMMLYAKYTGTEPTDDPYTITVTPGLSRDICKPIFNILINSDSRPKARGAIRQELLKAGLPADGRYITAIVDALFDKHRAISKAFFSGEGVRLQFLDSKIAEQVMVQFAGSYPVLPVHDSFLAHHALRGELDEAMKEAFKNVMGLSPRTKIGKSLAEFDWESKTPEEKAKNEPLPIDINNIINNLTQYSQYYARGKQYGS